MRGFMGGGEGPGRYDASYERQGQDYPLPYVRWTEKRNMEEFLRLAAQKSLRLDGPITHRVPLEEAAKADEIIMDPSHKSPAGLLHYSPPTDTVAVPGPTTRRSDHP